MATTYASDSEDDEAFLFLVNKELRKDIYMNFCPYCGTQLAEAKKFCVNCGKQLSNNPRIPQVSDTELPQANGEPGQVKKDIQGMEVQSINPTNEASITVSSTFPTRLKYQTTKRKIFLGVVILFCAAATIVVLLISNNNPPTISVNETGVWSAIKIISYTDYEFEGEKQMKISLLITPDSVALVILNTGEKAINLSNSNFCFENASGNMIGSMGNNESLVVTYINRQGKEVWLHQPQYSVLIEPGTVMRFSFLIPTHTKKVLVRNQFNQRDYFRLNLY